VVVVLVLLAQLEYEPHHPYKVLTVVHHLTLHKALAVVAQVV
jgi:hypothetical protein